MTAVDMVKYFTDEEVTLVREIKAGHINTTYGITVAGGKQYILQRINGYVFKDADAVMDNIVGATKWIRDKLVAAGEDPARRVMRFYPAKDGKYYVRDDEGNAWRLCDFIEGATAYDRAESNDMLREAGRAFGEFQRYLADYPADTLKETIPAFHDTTKRFENLKNAVKAADPARLAAAKEVLDAYLAREERLCLGAEMLKKGCLPLRVTHNDTKINNVMIDDATGRAICAVDLDTIMPGGVLNDFGDGIRTAAATAAEDEKDLSLVGISVDAYRAYAEGFMSEVGASLTQAERDAMELGCEAMTGECGARFLTDYLEGDVYFRIAYPEHNLVRAKNQMKMLQDIEAKRSELEEIIRNIK